MGFWEMWKQYRRERNMLKAMRKVSIDGITYLLDKHTMTLKSGKFAVTLVAKPIQDEVDPDKFCIELSGASFLADKKVLQAIWRECWENVAIEAETFPGQEESLTFSQVEARVRPLTFTAVVYHTIEV